MPLLTPARRRLLAWAIGPCIPAWAALLLLAVLGRLAWLDAVLAAAAILIILTTLTLRRLGDFDHVVRFSESLLENPTATPPELTHSATAVRALRSIVALREQWTVRRDQAEALARSRQLIIDALPDPLLLLDGQRRVRSTNAAARELLALEASAPALTIGTRVIAERDLASVIRDPKLLEAVDAALASRRPGEAELTFSGPVEHSYRALIVPLPEIGEQDVTMIISLTDLTEMRKIERTRADFVANASHELRTPLAAVLGFIETLRGPAKDDEAARMEFLDIMFKQASRMARLIDDLLSLSRIELHEHTRPFDTVDLANTVRAAAELLQPETQRRGSRIVITAAPDLPPALGDHSELSQVFSNLLANALKYGGERNKVDVTIEAAAERPFPMPGNGPCLKVAVRDYGEGIPREHIPRLTERFYRVDTARSRSLGGTGLGLAIVKHIVNRHRGALTIDSVEGQGATFTVWLPMAPIPALQMAK